MPTRTSSAVWEGALKTGKGTYKIGTGAVGSGAYNFGSRFEEGAGTNPEELVAAAHAGCFAMKLSFVLGAAGFTPDSLKATCTINLSPEKGAITNSHLVLKAKVPGISKEKFDECVEDARANCPISKLLNAEITVDSELHS